MGAALPIPPGKVRAAAYVGSVGILNVGVGDIKLSFDPANPAERIRAARVVADMLRRGYALLVENPAGSGAYTRATGFDEHTCEYIVADFDPMVAAAQDKEERHGEEEQSEAPAGTGSDSGAPQAPAKRRGRPPKRVDAGEARAVAVARTAGG